MAKLVILTYTPCAGGVALKVGWTLTQVAALLVDARPVLTVVWVLTLVDVCTTDTAALIKGLHDERHVRLYETGSFTNKIITVNVCTTNTTGSFTNTVITVNVCTTNTIGSFTNTVITVNVCTTNTSALIKRLYNERHVCSARLAHAQTQSPLSVFIVPSKQNHVYSLIVLW